MTKARPSALDDLHRYISPTEEVIEEARQGRMYILVDAEDRENEGDLIVPAQFATPDAVNFMAKNGRGLICLALAPERASALNLEMMAARNQTRHQTAFTISIEAKEGISTGISVHDRAHTIAVAIDPTKGADDIVSPGHVFPLIAREGGVLTRAGHTEASVDIARLAGLFPAAVICEVMNDDGAMARLPDLIAFAQLHNLKIGTISDLIAYRRENDMFVERVAEGPLRTMYGPDFRVIVYRNKLDGMEVAAVTRGQIRADRPTLVRMHRLDFTADVFGESGDRGGLISRALREIAAEPEGGVLVLLRDARPDALSRRLTGNDEHELDVQARMLREYGVGAQILRDIGVRRMVLLSNTPQKIVSLDGYGLTIDGWRAFKPATQA
ncbi:MAG TPA: 3,4-dihydroxy-2-butanone-4-phosphate synthase [Caulobacterales bacterium]|nr:3,4-dihydroxy-2-butanone-4-phosphate synthase [Caulobacterales bacterium]